MFAKKFLIRPKLYEKIIQKVRNDKVYLWESGIPLNILSLYTLNSKEYSLRYSFPYIGYISDERKGNKFEVHKKVSNGFNHCKGNASA